MRSMTWRQNPLTETRSDPDPKNIPGAKILVELQENFHREIAHMIQTKIDYGFETNSDRFREEIQEIVKLAFQAEVKAMFRFLVSRAWKVFSRVIIVVTISGSTILIRTV